MKRYQDHHGGEHRVGAPALQRRAEGGGLRRERSRETPLQPARASEAAGKLGVSHQRILAKDRG